jgi:sugar lactone lactonase YvrE
MPDHPRVSLSAAATRRAFAVKPPVVAFASAVLVMLALLLSSASADAAAGRARIFESAFPAGAFHDPTGVAVEQATGNVFVADSEAGTLEVVGAEGGAPAGGVVSPVAGFEFGSVNEPEEVAVDNSCYLQKLSGSACESADPANGDVYVSEAPGHAIVRLKLNTSTHEYEKETFVEPLQETEEHEDLPIEPNGVAVDSHGDVYIANYKARTITVYDPAGAKVGEVAQTLIEHPAYLAIGEPGVLYVGNYGGGVAKVEVNGSFAVQHEAMLATRPGGPAEPEGRAVAVDSEGNVLVDETSRIVVYSSTGAITEEFGAAEFEESRGVAVNDEMHDAYVTNPAGKDLEAFGSESHTSGPRSRILESAPFSARESFSFPTGAAVDEETGNVYVADSAKEEVDVYGAEGGAPAGGVTEHIKGFEGFGASEAAGVAVDNACYFHNPRLTGSACESFDPSNGDVYVAEEGGEHQVVKLKLNTGTGKYEKETLVHVEEEFAPNGVAVDTDGNVYVANYYDEVIEFDPAGQEVGKFHPTEINTPAYIAVGAPGVVYLGAYVPVGEEPVGVAKLEVNAKAEVQHEEMLAAKGGAVSVEAATENVLVDEGTHVTVYSSTGSKVEEFGAGEFNGSEGVAVNDETHDAYVTNPAAGNLEVFAPASEGATWVTGTATAIGVTTATLNGTVNPEGHAVSVCEFEYGTADSYGHSAPCKQSATEIGEGTRPTAVSAELTGLEPGTSYHYRIAGTNTKGPGHGSDQTFSTANAVQGVKTGPPSAVKITEATVEGSIEPDGAEIEYYFEYGTTTASGTKTATATVTGAEGEKKTVTATLTGLSGGTTYHYKLVAKNKLYSQLVSGEEEAFTTLPSVPAVITGEASEVTATSATLAGSLTPNEQKPEYEETEYYFEYAAATLTGSDAKTTPATIGRAEVEAHPGSREVSGVARFANSTEATTYHYRLAAHNSTGTTYGSEKTFTTQPTFAFLTIGEATAVTSVAAMLPGEFKSTGESETVYWLEYAPCHVTFGNFTCTPYTARTAEVTLTKAQIEQAETGSNDTGVGVQITLTGLQPGTSYGYRLSARNPTVTTSSAPRTFTTGPAAPVVESEQVGEITANGALLSATIDPGNSTSSSYPTSYYFEYQRPGLGDTEMVAPAAVSAGNRTVAITPERVAGLVPDSEYAYWLVAENASGKVEGAHQSFTTAAEPPAVAQPAPGTAPSTSTGLSQPASAALLPVLAPVPVPKPATHPTPAKPLTKAQKLAKALKSCRSEKKKSKRESCAKQARSKYAGKPKPRKKGKK